MFKKKKKKKKKEKKERVNYVYVNEICLYQDNLY